MNWTRWNLATIILSVAGETLASVISLQYISAFRPPCTEGDPCAQVTSSVASHLLGVPISVLGLAAYGLVGALAVARAAWPGRGILLGLGYLVSALGATASLGLTAYSVAVLHATCAWCLGSAAVMCLLLSAHAMLARSADSRPQESRLGTAVAVLLPSLLAGIAVLAGVVIAARSREASEFASPGSGLVKTLRYADAVPATAPHLGDPLPKISIVVFADLACPVCAEEVPKLKALVARRKGLQLVFRHFPLRGHEGSERVAAVSMVANREGKFWEFIDQQYRTLETGDPHTQALAAKLRLDPGQTLAALDPNGSSWAVRLVAQDRNLAKKLGFHTTPRVMLAAPGQVPELVSIYRVPDEIERRLGR